MNRKLFERLRTNWVLIAQPLFIIWLLPVISIFEVIQNHSHMKLFDEMWIRWLD